MKIKKPKIVIDLEPVVDILPLIYESKAEETDVIRKHIKDAYITKEDLSGISFCGVIFENCKFIDCLITKASFLDVIFKNCDLSNSNFSDGYFNRCEFHSCKWMGVNLYSNGIQHLSILNCNFKYANFDHSNLSYICMKETDMSNTSMSECKLKEFELLDTQFIQTNFFKTPLKGLDFTESKIGGLMISSNNEELTGAIVTAVQAADLARLLGVVIK